jgi:hypothetical protein
MALGQATPSWIGAPSSGGSRSVQGTPYSNPASTGSPRLNSFSDATGTHGQGWDAAFANGPNPSTQPAAPTNPYTQPYQQALGAYGAAYGADMTAAQNAAARAGATIPVTSAWYDTQRAGKQADFNLANQGIDLKYDNLGIDRRAADRDAAYYQNLLNVLNQQRDIVGLNFNNTQQKLQDQAATDVRGANSQATAGGAWLSPGRMNNISDIFKNYNTGLTSAELDRRNAILGYNEKEFGLKKSQEETGDTKDRLDITAKQYGLDRQQLKNTLDQGLAQLGYGQYMDTAQLLDKVDSSNAQEASVARQILQSVMQAGSAFNSGAMGDLYSRFFGG